MPTDDIAIYGAGGFGLEVAMLIGQINQVRSRWNLIGFFDDSVPLGAAVNEWPVLGGMHASTQLPVKTTGGGFWSVHTQNQATRSGQTRQSHSLVSILDSSIGDNRSIRQCRNWFRNHHKGSRKNNFAELALRFGSGLADPREQNHRNSELFRGF